MRTMNSGGRISTLTQLPRLVLAMLVAITLAACGGGGVVPSTSVAATETSRTLTAQWTEYVSRKAVNYSPFRSGNRDTETITAAMVKEDLQLLLMGDFRLIRLFDASDKVSRLTLQVIRDNGLDIKVQLGAYVQSDKYASEADKPGIAAYNDAELARTVALAKEFSDIVLAVSIGNETMVSWSFNPITPEVIAGYIRHVRGQIAQPVTSDDNWALYAEAPKVLIDAIDFAAIHTYTELDTVFAPDTFDWKQAAVPAGKRAAAMMDAAMAAARAQYDAVRAQLDLKGQAVMPIVIGETGWNAVNVGHLGYRAHPVNQKMYFNALQEWAREGRTGKGPANIIYFEAFDEPWKGADDKWGLFNVQRQARYVVQNLYPQSLWEPGDYAPADAVHWVPLGQHKVGADRFTLYAETYTLNEDRPSTPTLWNAWENGTTAAAAEVGGTSTPEGSQSLQVTPSPAVWGWGLALNLKENDLKTDTAADLSGFASGTLNFSIRTTYPGMIEVGFLSGTGVDGSAVDVYVPLVSGQYGYANDGAWHSVSIPLSALLAVAPKADLSLVTSPFVIADRYDRTGKAQGSAIASRIDVDGIHWAR